MISRSLSTAATFFPVVPLLACGPAADASPDQAAADRPQAAASMPAAAPAAPQHADVLGTIEATVDGERRTWYVVTGSVRGEPYASAVWFEDPAGDLVASIGGYDTADLPYDTFETDVDRGISFGDYTGSTFNILLMPDEVGPFSLTLTEGQPGLVYAPVATTGLDGNYFGQSGSLDVTRLEVVGDRLHAEGTFEGALSSMDGSEVVDVTDGRFQVEGIPPRSAVGSGG